MKWPFINIWGIIFEWLYLNFFSLFIKNWNYKKTNKKKSRNMNSFNLKIIHIMLLIFHMCFCFALKYFGSKPKECSNINFDIFLPNYFLHMILVSTMDYIFKAQWIQTMKQMGIWHNPFSHYPRKWII
jgi:hypothetical protein